jgi:hypothetical protein
MLSLLFDQLAIKSIKYGWYIKRNSISDKFPGWKRRGFRGQF